MQDNKQQAFKDLKLAVEKAANLVPGLFRKKPKVNAGWLLTKAPMEELVSALSEFRPPSSMTRAHREAFETSRRDAVKEVQKAWERYRKLSDPEATVPLQSE